MFFSSFPLKKTFVQQMAENNIVLTTHVKISDIHKGGEISCSVFEMKKIMC